MLSPSHPTGIPSSSYEIVPYSHPFTHSHSYVTFAPANPSQANLKGSGENKKTKNPMEEGVYCTVR